MEEEKKFVERELTSIINFFKDITLTDKILEQRTDLFLRSTNDEKDVQRFLDIENSLKQYIETTGKNKFTANEIKMIALKTLNLDKREYDKSYIAKPDEIKEINPIAKKEHTTYTFGNTTIMEVGALQYTDVTGMENLEGVSAYIVKKQDKKGKTSTYKVFSNILISKMDEDMDYRAAVLDVLLDERNMTESNCGGYIGRIADIKVDSSIPANDKYALIFDENDASAVMKFAKQQTNDKEILEQGER